MKSETGFDHDLYRLFPTHRPRPEGEVEELERIWENPKGWGLLTVVNNNYIGFFYVATAFLFFLLAGILALGMRVQLAAPLLEVLPQDTYNQFFTMHGTVMMFLFAVPMVEALGVMLLPQMLAARDLPFPRLSAFAFWAYFVGGLSFFASLFVGLAPEGGWFMYPPLTSIAFSPEINADFWLLGIGFIEISAIAGAIEIIVGVLRTRAPGMTLDRMPMFAWAMLVFAVMIIVAFPSVILCTLLLEMERAFNWPFFDPTRGGDPLLWQHLFWFLAHPEVYVLILPGMGIVAEIIANNTRKPIWGYKFLVGSVVVLGFLAFIVWAHHMYMTGMGTVISAFFQTTTLLISIPSVIILTCLLISLWGGSIRFNTPMLFALAFLPMFGIGGLTGLPLGFNFSDVALHDSYYVIAHFHYVVAPGTIFAIFAGVYYWFPKMTGRKMSEFWGRVHFWSSLIFMNLIFMPMFAQGMAGMSRRMSDGGATYSLANPDNADVTVGALSDTIMGLNVSISAAAWAMLVAQVPFIINLFWSVKHGEKVESDNPWQATTLEWETPTPPPHGNFIKEIKVYRDPYEYSVPGARKDFSPQAQPAK